ncbi:MAG: T9SS type A sorting domain-containing protein [Saprospiraceae bacterium]
MISNILRPNICKNIGLLLLAVLLSASVVFAASTPVNNNAADNDCMAVFDVLVTDDNITAFDYGTVTLKNLSMGEYVYMKWDFGDGNYCGNVGNIVSHEYESTGTFEIKLTVWNADSTCFSSFAKEIAVELNTDGCLLTECVWPGDANKDGMANSYDMLHMAMGFGATGPERSGDPEEWFGQSAEDWEEDTPDGVNYKYLDANGDGIIDEYDMIPVLNHYTPMNENFNSNDPDAPRIRLDFDIDTFVIDQYTDDFAYISAALIIGTADNPVEDIMGLSLYLEYDTSLVDLSSGITLDYNPNCFYGEQEDVLSYGRNIAATRQIDIGMARKTHSGSTGHGRVATVDFDIIIDIIDGRAEQEVKFPVTIKGVKAIDSNGDIINLNIDQDDATVVFIDKIDTSIKENPLNSQVTVYPNPVKDDFITVTLRDLTGSSAQFYNTLGQLIKSEMIDGSQTNISVADLSKGVYELVITTDEGIANKRLIIE